MRLWLAIFDLPAWCAAASRRSSMPQCTSPVERGAHMPENVDAALVCRTAVAASRRIF